MRGNLFAVAVDLVVLTVRDAELCALLVRRDAPPFAGRWGLPGGFVLPNEDLLETATRRLGEETGLELGGHHLEQLASYAAPDRDPRGRVLTVGHIAIVPRPPEPIAADASGTAWHPIAKLVDGAAADALLAFDHGRILADGRRRIGAKLEYTCLATEFCPPRFTLGELQQVYETVWGVALDRPNFRRKVLTSPGFVEPVEGPPRRTGGRGKPAALYRAGTATALHPPLLRPEGRSTP
jgi:8-oxo-dGTP diphosphatase